MIEASPLNFHKGVTLGFEPTRGCARGQRLEQVIVLAYCSSFPNLLNKLLGVSNDMEMGMNMRTYAYNLVRSRLDITCYDVLTTQ